MKKLYRQIELTHEQLDTYVFAHVMAMTSESLHNKAEIAAELGARDVRIAELDAKYQTSCKCWRDLVQVKENKIIDLERENLKSLGWIAQAMMQGLNDIDCSDELLKIIAAHNLEQQSIGIESCAVELERCYDVAVQEHGNFDEAETLKQLLDCIRKLKGGDV